MSLLGQFPACLAGHRPALQWKQRVTINPERRSVPHFVLNCRDAKGSAEIRPLHRDAHVAHVRGSGIVRIAGPMVDDAGVPVGSLLIVEADDLAAARAFADADPYAAAGVFASVDIAPFCMTYVDLPQTTG